MKPDTAPRRRWFSSLMVVAIGTLAVGTLANRAVTQVPGALPATAPEPTNVDPASKDYGTRAVAYINKNRVVTRAELAEFLIARGGYEKVELLVNKMIIEEAAREAKITVTTQEMEVAFADDLKISNPPIQKKDFVNVVLPRYGKSLYEWMEDVIRPRLLLTKMCRENVKVNPEDLTKAFEREYGEKRAVKIIIWPTGDGLKNVYKVWGTIRNDAVEFDRVARGQANASLAATAGEIKPIAKHIVGDEKDKQVETIAYALNEGEVSQIFETQQGFMVMKLLKKLPADATVKFENVKERLEREMFDIKLAQEIPKQFAKLNLAATPQILLNGPPTLWKFEQSAKEKAEDALRLQQAIQPVGGVAK